MAKLMRFYGGGIGYRELREMPISEMLDLIGETNKIIEAEKKAYGQSR